MTSQNSSAFSLCLFFFQAEDGIRDHCVTGVQTCALPILVLGEQVFDPAADAALLVVCGDEHGHVGQPKLRERTAALVSPQVPPGTPRLRDGDRKSVV